MTKEELDQILKDHDLWLDGEGGKQADLRWCDLNLVNLRGSNLSRADLRWVNLQEADLQETDLCGADLRGANLWGANLQRADLQIANLRESNLSGVNLRKADLRGADLRGVDLQGADLQGADLDFSCWPLWCGSNHVRVDAKIAAQLAAHFCVLECDDPVYLAARAALMEFAKTSHRAEDLGLTDVQSL